MQTITYEDFEKVEIRVGTILSAASFPEARKPAYKITIDFGSEIGIKDGRARRFLLPVILKFSQRGNRWIIT